MADLYCGLSVGKVAFAYLQGIEGVDFYLHSIGGGAGESGGEGVNFM